MMTKTVFDPVTQLPQVGPKRAETLATLGIETVNDLLTYCR